MSLKKRPLKIIDLFLVIFRYKIKLILLYYFYCILHSPIYDQNIETIWLVDIRS